MNAKTDNHLMSPLRAVARVVIELGAPLSIGTGAEGLLTDNAVVLDMNDLPGIPGTSIAGVLRATWAMGAGQLPDADQTFGFQRVKDPQSQIADGQRSRVRVSWGVLHTSQDVPAEGALDAQAVADPVLAAARDLVVRDHVRLNHRGAVDGRGKFERASVMAGNRFTFELEAVGEGAKAWLEKLLAFLADPAVRLGASTRSGLGAFSVVRAGVRAYDLRKELDAWIARPRKLGEPVPGLTMAPLTTRASAEGTRATYALTSVEPWQVGGGDGEGLGEEHSASKILPYTEARVVWQNNRGAVGAPELVLPASALKGALRHRTAFHLRALKKRFAHTVNDSGDLRPRRGDLDPHGPETEPEIALLFGDIKDSGDGERQGQAGLVFLADVRVPVAQVKLATATHLAVDRFTGGPMAGQLFQETSVGRTEIAVEVIVRSPTKQPENKAHFANGLQALALALRDLREGMLQVGAGAGRGYGYFEGQTPAWVGPLAAALAEVQ